MEETDLGSDALPYRFNPIPIYNFYDYDVNGDINYANCEQLNEAMYYYVNSVENWADYADIFLPYIGDDVAEYFGYPAGALNFTMTYFLADAIVSQKFEGYPLWKNFTDDQWFYVLNIAKWVLLDTFDKNTRNLFITKM